MFADNRNGFSSVANPGSKSLANKVHGVTAYRDVHYAHVRSNIRQMTHSFVEAAPLDPARPWRVHAGSSFCVAGWIKKYVCAVR
jgi:phosphatidylserine/phosphatidylglycerophosphate/cardiolipin synthase-like enzyme